MHGQRKRHTDREKYINHLPISNSCYCTLLKLHDITCQGTRFVRKYVFDLNEWQNSLYINIQQLFSYINISSYI